ncbi:hypothetical protein [Microbacterium halotolerans]|uniref:hypothetical protein n=1 Tax=Microbacterium halotolerans TaxID=246613 RepID=UPI000E6ACE7A|nr:hypothetical protein [Microbacterium halotolerans]
MYGPTGEVVGQLEDVADASNRIPEEENIKVTADTTIAQSAIDRFIALNSTKKVQIATGIGGTGGLTKADGGIVSTMRTEASANITLLRSHAQASGACGRRTRPVEKRTSLCHRRSAFVPSRSCTL